jgi:hypothetical protein
MMVGIGGDVMKMLRWCLAAVAAVAASPALADSYYPLVVGKTSILVDLTTLKREGDIAKVWSILVKEGTVDFDFALGRDEINCSTDERRNVAVTTYRMSGDLVRSEYVVRAWEPIIPQSREALLETAVCNGPPDPKLVITTADPPADIVRKIKTVVSADK